MGLSQIDNSTRAGAGTTAPARLPAPLVAASPKRARWPWRHPLALTLAAAFVIAAAYCGMDLYLGPEVTTIAVERTSLLQTVVVTGHVAAPASVSIGSVITGRVVSIPVSEGQRVRRGDILINLDDSSQRAAVAQAEASEAQALAKISSISDFEYPTAVQSLSLAVNDAQLAGKHFLRAQQLFTQGFLSQSELDDVRNVATDARSRLLAASVQVEAKQPNGSDAQLALAALANAQSSLKLAQSALSFTTIRAANGGVLVSRSVEVGDVVQPGHELMALAISGDTHVEAQVDEKQLAVLSAGQQAWVSADAFPSRRFEAQLYYINPGIDAQRGSVTIKLRVANPPAYLRQDMTVSIDLDVARKESTLTVPADFVRDDTSGLWVMALENGHVLRHEVRTGLRGEGRVEIVEGAHEGDHLVSAIAFPSLIPGIRARDAGSH